MSFSDSTVETMEENALELYSSIARRPISKDERETLLALHAKVKAASLRSSDAFQKGRLQELADRIHVTLASRHTEGRTQQTEDWGAKTSRAKGVHIRNCFDYGSAMQRKK